MRSAGHDTSPGLNHQSIVCGHCHFPEPSRNRLPVFRPAKAFLDAIGARHPHQEFSGFSRHRKPLDFYSKPIPPQLQRVLQEIIRTIALVLSPSHHLFMSFRIVHALTRDFPAIVIFPILVVPRAICLDFQILSPRRSGFSAVSISRRSMALDLAPGRLPELVSNNLMDP
jgi:hypothetical protein